MIPVPVSEKNNMNTFTSVSLCVSVYECMCVSMYVYMYVCMFICVCVCVCQYMCVCVRMVPGMSHQPWIHKHVNVCTMVSVCLSQTRIDRPPSPTWFRIPHSSKFVLWKKNISSLRVLGTWVRPQSHTLTQWPRQTLEQHIHTVTTTDIVLDQIHSCADLALQIRGGHRLHLKQDRHSQFCQSAHQCNEMWYQISMMCFEFSLAKEKLVWSCFSLHSKEGFLSF